MKTNSRQPKVAKSYVWTKWYEYVIKSVKINRHNKRWYDVWEPQSGDSPKCSGNLGWLQAQTQIVEGLKGLNPQNHDYPSRFICIQWKMKKKPTIMKFTIKHYVRFVLIYSDFFLKQSCNLYTTTQTRHRSHQILDSVGSTSAQTTTGEYGTCRVSGLNRSPRRNRINLRSWSRVDWIDGHEWHFVIRFVRFQKKKKKKQ